MKRYLCIHGHFYQPPRENPWKDEVEVQASAAPYHDWNERITAECYMPNTAARIVDHERRILDIVNNYELISFNFGPTLLSWMERAQPSVYHKIVEADQISVRKRGGHGNALAQAYNHLIMPLASLSDKITQVKWAVSDFESRFKRRPEGMWLPETAVDLETLYVLAQEGIQFTILAPHQASRIRKGIAQNEPSLETETAEGWEDVSGSKIDPTRPYRCFLPEGLYIDLFFYDGPISHAVAFDRLLQKGEKFVERLQAGFSDTRDWPQLLNIATDGESYGHHCPHGDMALAYTLQQIERQQTAELTNYGEYLSLNPPVYQVEIFERSSWSCAHGVDRWQSNCGCSTGHSGWNQQWRRPLREGLDLLKTSLDNLFEEKGGEYIKNPWNVRNAYIELIRKREEGALTPEDIDTFLIPYRMAPFSFSEREAVLKLLEMQRNALLMFTSCAWFWDDVSGYETRQVLQYAARAIDLAKAVDKKEQMELAEGAFMEKLKEAPSNITELGSGASIYQHVIKASKTNPKLVIAHFAILSLLETTPMAADLYGYRLDGSDYQRIKEGLVTFGIGRVHLTSKITFETQEAAFGVLHFGGPDFHCAVGGSFGADQFENVKFEIIGKLMHDSQAAVIRCMNHYFGEEAFTLKDLFLDARRKVLSQVANLIFKRYENRWRHIYQEHHKLMLYLQSTQTKIPRPFLVTAEQVYHLDLKNEMGLLPHPAAIAKVLKILDESKQWGIDIPLGEIATRIEQLLEKQLTALIESHGDQTVEVIYQLLDLVEKTHLHINIWESQNLFHRFINEQRTNGGNPLSGRMHRLLIQKLAKRLSYHLTDI